MSKMNDKFVNLTPDSILNAVEAEGFLTTGRYTQLNSYENRVFSIEVESEEGDLSEVIGKFYRPNRWSKEAIQEEHDFLFDLKSSGQPAVAPLVNAKTGQSLFQTQGIVSCLFPKALGRIPQELSLKELQQIGRLLARLHNTGASKKSSHRPALSTEHFGDESLKITEALLTPEIKKRYLSACDQILNFIDDHLDTSSFIRIHGDCHKGNLLQTDPLEGPKEFFFVDFDDFILGPPAYDFWMLFSGDDLDKESEAILTGYEELRNFDRKSLNLIAPFRGLRMIYYSAWIARRWQIDPSFKTLFPNFANYLYWAEETEALEKIAWSL